MTKLYSGRKMMVRTDKLRVLCQLSKVKGCTSGYSTFYSEFKVIEFSNATVS